MKVIGYYMKFDEQTQQFVRHWEDLECGHSNNLLLKGVTRKSGICPKCEKEQLETQE